MAAAHSIEWDKVEIMVNYCRDNRKYRDLMILLVACTTAFRHADWGKLKWSDLLGKDSIRRLESKTQKHRQTPIPEFIARQIMVCYEATLATLPPSQRHTLPDRYIFKPDSKNSRSGVLTRTGVNHVLNRIAQAVGFNHPVTVHSLRKAWGMRTWHLMGETEAAMVFVSNMFGHSSLAITQRYLGLELKMRKEIIEQMWT